MIPSSPPEPLSVGIERPVDRSGSEGYVLWPRLPDPTGFAGNFAACLNGCLLTGGGSRFPKQPLWLDGRKAYSDRMFILSSPGGEWREVTERLPRKMAHFAFAASPDAVYLVGGMAAGGALKQVFEIRAGGMEIGICTLPPLPEPLVYGAAAVAGGRLHVVGGQRDLAVKSAGSECWSLKLGGGFGGESWRREPDLPGGGTILAGVAVDGDDLYLIGGMRFDSEGRGLQLKEVFRRSVAGEKWERLADLPAPRVGVVTPCPVIGGKRILVMGGFEKAFSGELREHPGFCRQTFVYEPAGQVWKNGPVLPHAEPAHRDATGDDGPAPMVAAPGAIWQEHFVVIGGEVRASTRTACVLAFPLSVL